MNNHDNFLDPLEKKIVSHHSERNLRLFGKTPCFASFFHNRGESQRNCSDHNVNQSFVADCVWFGAKHYSVRLLQTVGDWAE